jgi:hypothetical protein
MSAVAMKLYLPDSINPGTTRGSAAVFAFAPAAMIRDRRNPDAPSRGAQNALQAIGDHRVGLYPHPKIFISIATRVRARQASPVNTSTTKKHRANDNHPQIRGTEKRPKTMLVTNPQNR